MLKQMLKQLMFLTDGTIEPIYCFLETIYESRYGQFTDLKTH